MLHQFRGQGPSYLRRMFGKQLVLEYDATGGAEPGVLRDLSPWGNHLAQATGANQPALALAAWRGNHALRFAGSHWLTRASFSGCAAGDFPRMYCVASFNTASTNFTGAILSLGNTATLNRGMYINHFTTTIGFLARRNGTFRYASGASSAGNNSTPTLYDGRNDTSNVVIAVNGTDVATAAVGSSVGLELTPDRVSLGILEDLSSQPLTGDFFWGAVINNPSATDDGRIKAYLRVRFPGITIA